MIVKCDKCGKIYKPFSNDITYIVNDPILDYDVVELNLCPKCNKELSKWFNILTRHFGGKINYIVNSKKENKTK